MFKLSIECTKDISSLNIVFSDGKTANIVSESEVTPAQPVIPVQPEPVGREVNLTQAGDTNISSENHMEISKPTIPDVSNRAANVATNLQKLDI